MHSCPDCAQACYCDLDDHFNDDGDDGCIHCPFEDDEPEVDHVAAPEVPE